MVSQIKGKHDSPATPRSKRLSKPNKEYDITNTTYNSEDDSDYHPEDDSEFGASDDDDEDFEDDDTVVFDEVKKNRNGICSSSSSVSLDGEDVKNKLLPDDLTGNIPDKKGEPALKLKAHNKFGDFIHKHEIPRKFLHVSIGFITLYFYTQGLDTKMFIPYLSTACAIIFSLDLVRFKIPAFNKAYCQAVGFLMREKEIDSYNGVIWYLLGLTIAFQPFPKDIGVMAVLLLSWSDTAASTFGRAYGHLTPKIAKHKSLAGSIAAFVTGIISCLVFYGYFVPTYKYTEDILWSQNTSRLSLPVYSMACGFIAALSEGIDILNWDDNFTIPTLSGIFLYSLVKAVEIH
ncbi:diacylglycerol kinase [Saccharomycopsis crataegensis]|uniref:Diacylglycerol kinase n=1 Tax=Saccharomycopsis crataegensis TaxID=43959 RepID=A0AAV5QU05_9ASCO|nr:diacylglycerol kinase [Saccharomycopsis crataegensis]